MSRASMSVLGLGIATSLLVALFVLAIDRMTGLNLFSFSVWLVVPVGAGITGFAASSGFYYGSLYFHAKATRRTLAQMIATAGATQMLIYYLDYKTYLLEDGTKASVFFSFTEFLDIILTSASYTFTRGQVNTGEVGDFGYAIALLQFAGFCFGGYTLYTKLQSKILCERCDVYLRKLTGLRRLFVDSDSCAEFYSQAAEGAVDPKSLSSLLAKVPAKEGTFAVELTLHGCPRCKGQELETKTELWNQKDWQAVEDMWVRRLIEGDSLVPVFAQAK